MTENRKTLDRTAAKDVLASCMTGNAYDPKLVDGHITFINKAGAKLDGTIHAAAVACIYLSMPHSTGGHNCAVRAVRLMNAMPKGSRAKALAAWFTAYSNIRVNFDKQAGLWKGGVLKPTAKGYVDARPDEAMAKPFWSVEERGTDPADFTTDAFAKAIAKLIARAKGENAKLDAKGKAALADLTDAALKVGGKIVDGELVF